MPQFLKIALLMGTDLGYCRGVMTGVQRFAAEGRPWVFQDAPPELDVLPSLVDWRPDGIIAHLFQRDVARAVMQLRRPLVNTTYTLSGLRVPLVEVDHFAVGRMAADHFLERGFRHFGYLGNTTVGFARQREAGFRRRLRAAGMKCTTCHAEFFPRLKHGASWSAIDARVRDWVLAQGRPLAVLASNDVPARMLTDSCRQLGLHSPEDVAILGVDNDELECSLAYPPLSSVAIPAEQIGYEAAKMLDRLMQSRQRVREQPRVFLPPVRVVTRQSTDIFAVDDAELATVLRFIQAHACDGIRVDDILEALPIARRTLEKRFHHYLGRSPHDEIRRVQIGVVKDLLATSNFSITEIAQRTGFSTSQRLAVVFRHITGDTCLGYRRRMRYGAAPNDR